MAVKRFQGSNATWLLILMGCRRQSISLAPMYREGALAMFSLSNQTLNSVQRVMVDGGYTGQDFLDQVKLILNANTTVAKRNELHTFKVLPQRWIIEHSWSWLDKCRRLWKNCERKLNSSLQIVVLAYLALVLRRY